MITNAKILRDYERRLRELERDMRGTTAPAMLAEMRELRENFLVSIADLRGAIKMGADGPNNAESLFGWCLEKTA